MINFGKVATAEVVEIVSIIEDLRNTSSTNTKKAILEKNKNNEGLKNILELTYNPFKKYKITEKSLEEGVMYRLTCESLNILLHLLETSNIDNHLRSATNNFLTQTDEEIRDLYRCVILKDLKIGVNISTINKVWKGLIPTSETGVEVKPMLASKFDFDKPPKSEFAVTEKLDGIRCIAICTYEGIELYSRQGKLIEGCVEIEDALRKLQAEWDCEFVLDGELLANDCDYQTVYKETTKRVKNKNLIKTGIHFMVFDAMDIIEFRNQKCDTPYYHRITLLSQLNNTVGENPALKFIQLLYIGNDTNRLLMLLDEYRFKGAEGLMVNMLDAPYEFKRSKNILKVKVMQTADLKIIGFEEGQGRNVGKLGAIIVEYKNSTVKVGSGYTDFDREYIWKNQHMYLGRVIEVSYFEESKNKDGVESLRFPVFKELREIGKEVSYH